ncbi:ABC transporter substrate-binding protein [Chloroflexota bacterium]
MTKKFGWVVFTLIIVLTLILAACAQATPEPEEVMEEPAAPAEEVEMPLAGETVTIFTAAADEQATAFQAEFDDFTSETGIEVVVEGSGDFEVLATTRAEAGDLPDIINFPQPGLMADLARDGYLIDLSPFLSNEYLLQQYDQSWIDQGTVDGTLVGIWHNADVKSLVWYPKAAFDAAGYTVPETWDELLALSDQIVADGGVPWCIGMESASATGWVGTDWIEDIMLRTNSLESYDQWVSGELDFASPEVKDAWETAAEVWLNPDYVFGGTTGILTIAFGDSPLPLFEDPPGCFLHKQASFVVNFFPEDSVVGEDVDYFYFPPINEADYGKPVLTSGSILSMGQDNPAIRKVMEFLTTKESVEYEVKQGLFVAPQKDVPLEWYPSAALAGFAEILANADSTRFDGGDLMPGAVGTGSFWTGVVDFVGGKDLDTVLQDIDNSWPAE